RCRRAAEEHEERAPAAHSLPRLRGRVGEGATPQALSLWRGPRPRRRSRLDLPRKRGRWNESSRHSITSSARSRTEVGTSRPSAFAVLILETFARKRERDSLRAGDVEIRAMAQRKIGQLGLLDAALAQRGEGRRDVLDEINRLLDWSTFERALSKLYTAPKGEAPYPPLMMFKVLLLQRWHSLSDPQMEVALFDRLSFQRFAGLSLDDKTPDHTTIWRFGERLGQDGLIELLMAELTRQLDQHGLVIKQGTLIDASLVASAARRPRMDEGRESAVDPDARFGTANDRGRFIF